MASPDSLANVFATAINTTIKTIESEMQNDLGWVPAKYFEELRKLHHLSPEASNSVIVRELISKIENFDTFIRRSNFDLDEKVHMARFFWRMALTGICIDSKINKIFIEASSTCSYVSDRYITILREEPYYGDLLRDNISIFTNSFFSYMQFLTQNINTRFPLNRVSILPPSCFSDSYGEAFGAVQNTAQIPASSFAKNDFLLREDASKSIKINKKLFDKNLGDESGIILMSLTGIQINSSEYEGGFVNSYRNCLFKRSLMMADCAKVIFVDGSKWNKGFNKEFQYPIFTDNLKWSEFIEKSPVCFVFSTKVPHKKDGIIKYFRERGLNHDLVQKFHSNDIIIIFNNSFLERTRII